MVHLRYVLSVITLSLLSNAAAGQSSKVNTLLDMGAKRSGRASDDPEHVRSHCTSSGAMRGLHEGQGDQAT